MSAGCTCRRTRQRRHTATCTTSSASPICLIWCWWTKRTVGTSSSRRSCYTGLRTARRCAQGRQCGCQLYAAARLGASRIGTGWPPSRERDASLCLGRADLAAFYAERCSQLICIPPECGYAARRDCSRMRECRVMPVQARPKKGAPPPSLDGPTQSETTIGAAPLDGA